MKNEDITFPCQGLSLEGICHIPEGDGPFAAAVVCHPHPLYGGDMDNNVVLAICQALVQRSILALRFNFRGVGRSQGSFADGIGEQEDVAAALSYLATRPEVDSKRLGLAGYSFGASVALSLAPRLSQVEALALVSPPPAISPLEQLKDYLKPKLLLCGSRDPFVPWQELERLSQSLPEPKAFEVIPRADHFWWGFEAKVAERLGDFMALALAKPGRQG